MYRLLVRLGLLIVAAIVTREAQATNCFEGQPWRDYEEAKLVEDDARAVQILESLYASKQRGAAWELGMAHTDGKLGLSADPAKAQKLLEEAAKQGDARADGWIGIRYQIGRPPLQQNEKTAATWLAKAKRGLAAESKKGCFDSATILSGLYNDGGPGLPQDKARALAVWIEYLEVVQRLAAKRADARARYEVVRALVEFPRWLMFQKDWDVLKRHGEAVKILEPLAAEGYLPGKFRLSLLLRNDKATYFDLSRARRLLIETAGAGYVPAMTELGAELSGVPGGAIEFELVRDRKRGRALLEKAQASGSGVARGRLAELERFEQCKVKNPLELFGLRLACLATTRDNMRTAIERAGGKALRKDNKYFYDQFEASRLLKGASELFVGYRVDDQTFASATYIFKALPSQKNAVYTGLIELLKDKYGNPKTSNEFWTQWDFHDPYVFVKLKNEFNRVELRYEYFANQDHLEKQIEANKKREKQREAQSQSNAF